MNITLIDAKIELPEDFNSSKEDPIPVKRYLVLMKTFGFAIALFFDGKFHENFASVITDEVIYWGELPLPSRRIINE